MSLASVQNSSEGVPADLHAPTEPDIGLPWPWRLLSLAWQQPGQSATPLADPHPTVNSIARSTCLEDMSQARETYILSTQLVHMMVT